MTTAKATMATDDTTTNTNALALTLPALRVLRWLTAIPMVLYSVFGLMAGLAALGALGWAGLTQASVLNTWMTVLGEGTGRNWFDLMAVFFERKLTLVLFDYPLVGEQAWWWWIRPAFDQAPVVWLGIAVGWALVWLALGFLVRRAKAATDLSIN